VTIDTPGWDRGDLARLELAPPASSRPTLPLLPGTEAFAPEWLVAHHQRGTTSALPAMGCYFIRDAIVSGTGQIWLDDRLVTAPDLLPRYLRAEMGLDGTQNQGMLRARQLPERVIDAPTAVLAGHGLQVYGHFLIEMLFHFMLVDQATADQGHDVHYLLDRAAPDWLLRILTQDLRIPAANLVFFNPRSERVRLRRAIVPTHVGGEEQGFHPLAATLADRAAARLTLPAIRTPRRVFAARLDFRNPAAGGSRVCQNEHTLIGIAQREQGFQPVSLQQLPWPHQVALFQNAEITLGLSGSALHTGLFSRPGSRMGVIGFGALVQSNISALRQSQIGYLARDINIHGAFTIDENAFRGFLTALCATPA
jgi:capsular polysaccharide biosynthesis protein